jgi:hypothetical protein
VIGTGVRSSLPKAEHEQFSVLANTHNKFGRSRAADKPKCEFLAWQSWPNLILLYSKREDRRSGGFKEEAKMSSHPKDGLSSVPSKPSIKRQKLDVKGRF